MKEIINRRDFLISLGAGTSLVIAGFVTTHLQRTLSGDGCDRPELSGLVKKSYKDGYLVLRLDESSACFVNRTGECVVDLLDGRRSLTDICRAVAERYGVECTDALNTSVALFICRLGSSGFLTSPFYVMLYENYV
jgi:hypothetical protein